MAMGKAALIIGAAAMATASAAEDTMSELQPLGPWQLDMAENKCRIARLFGDAAAPTLLYLEQWEPGRIASWAMAGPATKSFSDRQAVRYAFGPDGADGDTQFLDSTLGEYGRAIEGYSTVVPFVHEEVVPGSAPPARELGSTAATTITDFQLSQGRREARLKVGSLAAPLAAMNTCMDDLVAHWGFDPAQQRQIVAPAHLTNRDKVANLIVRVYPREALGNGAQADFVTRLSIDATGGDYRLRHGQSDRGRRVRHDPDTVRRHDEARARRACPAGGRDANRQLPHRAHPLPHQLIAFHNNQLSAAWMVTPTSPPTSVPLMRMN